jgi:serine/threonine protein kinase
MSLFSALEASQSTQGSEVFSSLEESLDFEKKSMPSALASLSLQEGSSSSQSRSGDLSKYQISEFLGKGKFSVVVLSKDESSKEVALKITRLKDSRGNDVSSASYDKFHEKSLAVQSLPDHSCIMKTYDSFSTSQEISVLKKTLSVEVKFDSRITDFFKDYSSLNSFYFERCEYLSGSEVFDEVHYHGSFGPDYAQFTLANAVRMVEHLQKNRMVHRDIKPENIVLDVEGNLKLVDFGFAKKFAEQEELRLKTLCGTAEYLPPELYKGQECNAFPVDIWGIGVVAYVVMSSIDPFYGDKLYKIREAILNGEPRYGLHCFKGDLQSLPVRMKNCIQGLFQKEPGSRFTIEDIKKSEALRDINWKLLEEGRFISPFLSERSPNYAELKNKGTISWRDRTKVVNVEG